MWGMPRATHGVTPIRSLALARGSKDKLGEA